MKVFPETAKNTNDSVKDTQKNNKKNIILPGFEPINLKDGSINLGAGRSYIWRNSLFPVEFSIDEKKVAGPIQLNLKVQGEFIQPEFSDFQIVSLSDAFVEIETKGHFNNLVDVTVFSRIEYDGVAMVTLQVSPREAIEIDELSLTMSVMRNKYSNMLAYKADTIRDRVKQVVFPAAYKGEFLNAVGFPNGQNSFWFFADNAEGWVWNGDSVTEVNSRKNSILLKQKLIGSTWRLAKNKKFRFNYLLTPVKRLSDADKSRRIARSANAKEARYSDTHVWWTTAFAHIDYPYFTLDSQAKKKVPKRDLQVYPGLDKNRQLLGKWKALGVDRIPYFSAHALSTLDPYLMKNRSAWEVLPPFVMAAKSDNPYSAKLAKPWLTHRASGYSDYLLARFDVLVPQLGMEGVYFDQAGVIQSNNPSNGLWIDSNGKQQASLDILAMRSFYKRLANIFYMHKKKGIIVVHNSMAAIIPAYSFVESMVQGEEYIHKLHDLDYVSSTSLNQVRSQFSGEQYGISTVWLSELWSDRVKQGKPQQLLLKDWLNSEKYKTAFRNYLSLALLHNSRIYSVAPLVDRAKIYRVFDRFDYVNAEFFGYWRHSYKLAEDVYMSYFQHNTKPSKLVVLANFGQHQATINMSDLCDMLGGKERSRCTYRLSDESDFHRLEAPSRVVPINKKDFLLMEIRHDFENRENKS